MKNDIFMPSERCIAELVHPVVTGAELNYQGSITIDSEVLERAGILSGQMVYIDDVDRKGPPWRTYTVPGNAGAGDIIMNGPPAYHFKHGNEVTVRAGALIAFADHSSMGHTMVYFAQGSGAPNRMANVLEYPIPTNHWRQMCISKLHRLAITHVSPKGPEALVVDEDILDAAGFPKGIEVQFTSLADGTLRRTCVQAGPRGTGIAIVQGSGAQYVAPGIRIVTLAEAWLSYEDAIKVGGPQVAFFDEKTTGRNVIQEVKPGWRPS